MNEQNDIRTFCADVSGVALGWGSWWLSDSSSVLPRSTICGHGHWILDQVMLRQMRFASIWISGSASHRLLICVVTLQHPTPVESQELSYCYRNHLNELYSFSCAGEVCFRFCFPMAHEQAVNAPERLSDAFIVYFGPSSGPGVLLFKRFHDKMEQT